MKIGFLTTIRHNVGDEFIRHGIKNVLDKIGIQYSPFYVDKHDVNSLQHAIYDEDHLLEDKYRQSDVFIQAGAPVYWNLKNGAQSINSGWSHWFWRDRVFTDGPGPKFLNLGAGSCQEWGDTPDSFTKDKDCCTFAHQTIKHSLLTTVRDPLAGSILESLGHMVPLLPCPAFLAGAGTRPKFSMGNLIGVNLMELGGHYDLEGNFNVDNWSRDIRSLLDELRKMGRVVFISHNIDEMYFQNHFLQPGERIFHSDSWIEYLELYQRCAFVVANRVHGAVVAGGFGVPSVILGNDSRAQIGEPIGIPYFRSGHFRPRDLACFIKEIWNRHTSDALLQRRDLALAQYKTLLSPFFS